MRLHAEPLALAEANALVAALHRHHAPCTGHRFSIGVFDEDGSCRGAAIVGRPVGGGRDQLVVAEVSRLVTDGTRNACSMLYQACARAAQAQGYLRIQTFILDWETGASLRASGWEWVRLSHPTGWGNGSRPRGPLAAGGGRKQLWQRVLNDYVPAARPAGGAEPDTNPAQGMLPGWEVA